MSSTVFFIEDDSSLRRSLQALARSIELKAQAFESAEQFLETFEPEDAACIVSDLRLPGMNGIELARVLHERRVTCPMIMLTGYGDVATAKAGLALGLLDFLVKPVKPALLIERIRCAIEQNKAVRGTLSLYCQIQSRLEKLTPRETQTLHGILEGKASKQIAFELDLARKTVDKHRAQVMAKMGAANAVELARMVFWAQYVSLAGPESALSPPPVSELVRSN